MAFYGDRDMHSIFLPGLRELDSIMIAPDAPGGSWTEPTVRAHAVSVGEKDGLPRIIEEEFRGFLRCGLLAGGFARSHCAGCGLDRLAPFSCKGRAVLSELWRAADAHLNAHTPRVEGPGDGRARYSCRHFH